MLRLLRKFVPDALIRFARRGKYGERVGTDLPDHLRQRIRDHYAKGNTWLAKRTGLDLAALGYSVESS